MWRLVLATMAACAPQTVGSAADAPPQQQASAYHGTLAQSETVQFGGMPYCTYSMTLKSLALDLMVSAQNTVTSATMQNLNIEATVGTCQYAPTPPTTAKYAFAGNDPLVGGSSLTFDADPGNATGVALKVDLAPDGAGFTAMATFHRIDQVAALDWTVTATMSLAK